MSKLIEALESLDAVADFNSPLGVTAKVVIHNPLRKAQESFLKRFGFESYDYIEGTDDVEGFYSVKVNEHIFLYSRFRPSCEHGISEPALSNPVVAFAIAYDCFSGNCEYNLENPRTDADTSIEFQITAYGSTPEQAVKIAQKHSLPILPQEHDGFKWLRIGETLNIFLEK